jgi:hypothetical protein
MAKVNLHPNFKELLELLNSAKVKYLILGGYARKTRKRNKRK